MQTSWISTASKNSPTFYIEYEINVFLYSHEINVTHYHKRINQGYFLRQTAFYILHTDFSRIIIKELIKILYRPLQD